MSILGEKVFVVGLEEEGGGRLVLVLELVFLVISMAYICLSVCPLQLEMMLMLGTRLERREKK